MIIRLRHIIIQIFALLCFSEIQAQEEFAFGEVSFVTSSSIYVQFDNTETLNVGDTLTVVVNGEDKACLRISHKSSRSCVCEKLEDCTIEKGMVAKSAPKPLNVLVLKQENTESNDAEEIEVLFEISDTIESEGLISEELKLQRDYGRISASSYSSFDQSDIRHRFMARASYNIYNIKDSRFSFESYLNYRENIEVSAENPTERERFFRVYNAVLSYQYDSTGFISIGRKVNRKMSSVGAVDGIQVDKTFNGKTYIGLIAGFRPDLIAFDLNTKLFQYGMYVGRNFLSKKVYGHITAGFLEQRNGTGIDRRYSYFQLSSTINSNISVFASSEMDLYNINSLGEQIQPRLTNLYASLRYKFSRKISISVSYDSRRRIIFYETLRTEIERLLADDEARQGVRARLNLRPFKYISAGASYSYRFQNSQQNTSKNLNAYISLARVPAIAGRLSVNYNQNESEYLRSRIMSFRYNRAIVSRKVNLELYFRNVNYSYIAVESKLTQNYYGAALNFNLGNSIGLHILSELSQFQDRHMIRFNTKLIKRF